MRSAFVQLHISVVLAGFTGVFGRLITLSEGLLVFYRMLAATVLFFIMLKLFKRFQMLAAKDVLQISLVGFLLAIHWVFFYGSVKAANVSVAVVCCSITGFFTAIIEPILTKRRFMPRELIFSFIALLGVLLIFHFDSRYRLGIVLGIIAALLAALYTIGNKRLSAQYPPYLLLFYQIAGGFVLLSTIAMPIYLSFVPVDSYYPSGINLLYLLIFVIFCTIILYSLQIFALRQLSAFTMNLTYNLEPLYTIIFAAFIFHETQELNASFYAGLGLIMLSVLLQMWAMLRARR